MSHLDSRVVVEVWLIPVCYRKCCINGEQLAVWIHTHMKHELFSFVARILERIVTMTR